jgi:hypothetical protein
MIRPAAQLRAFLDDLPDQRYERRPRSVGA